MLFATIKGPMQVLVPAMAPLQRQKNAHKLPPVLPSNQYCRHLISSSIAPPLGHLARIKNNNVRRRGIATLAAADSAADMPLEPAATTRTPAVALTVEAKANQNLRLLLTASVVIFAGIANRVLYKMALTPLQDYVFFLAQLQTFGYVVVYYGFLLLRYQRGKVTKEMLQIPKTFWPIFLCIGLVEALASLLSFIGASRLPGIVLPLLSQTIMLWQVMLAYATGRRLTSTQLVGVGLVLGGVLLAGWPADPSKSPLSGIDPIYAAIFVISMLFPAIDTLLKERIFRLAKPRLKPKGRDLDLFVLNSFGSLSQALFVFLLLPIVTAVRGMNMSQLPNYLMDGWSCFRGLTPSCGGDCSGAPLLPLLYVGFNLAFNIATLNLIRQAGNVVVSLVMSAIVPCTLFAFTLPLPYLPTSPPLGPSFVWGAMVLMLGLLVYNAVMWWPSLKVKIAKVLSDVDNDKGGDGGGVVGIVAR